MADKIATGSLTTLNAQKYINQLCKHWSHKAGAMIDETAGKIAFDTGNHLDLEPSPDRLEILASTDSDGDLEHWKTVVEAHLKRFAFREDFDLKWRS